VMTTVQTEARFHTAGRLGAVAFLGFGQVMPTLGDLFSARMHVAGGVGARYQLTRDFPMHLRFDLSWGDDGSLFYFGVAEAF
jgi:outer membrane translocation and assembly module TamA